MSDNFILKMNVDPMSPTATAATRVRRMRHLVEMIRESGCFTGFLPRSSLQDNTHGLSLYVKMTPERCDLPVEDGGVRRIQQTEESTAVDDCLSNHQVHIRSRTIRACVSRRKGFTIRLEVPGHDGMVGTEMSKGQMRGGEV